MCWGLYGLHHIFCSYFSASYRCSWSIDREGTAPRSMFMFEPLFSGTFTESQRFIDESSAQMLLLVWKSWRTACLCRAQWLGIRQWRGYDEVLGDHVTRDGSDHSRCWADYGGRWWRRAALSCTTEPRTKTGHVVGINNIWRLANLKPLFRICFQKVLNDLWCTWIRFETFLKPTRSCERIWRFAGVMWIVCE